MIRYTVGSWGHYILRIREVGMAESLGSQQALRLEAAVQAFVDRIQAVPGELLQRSPKPGEWTLTELAAHSAEIYSYWAKQVADLKGRSGQPFGRTASDADRIKFVEDHSMDSIAPLVATIRQGASAAAAALRSYTDGEWRSVTGVHEARGEMTMDAISNLFLAGHAEEHLKQFDETLAKLRS